MKINYYILFALVFCMGILPSCKAPKDKIPSDILPEKKMQLVFADALVAEGFIMETGKQDSQKAMSTKYYSEIFDRYHITRDEYFKSYDYYVKHPAIFEKILGPVIDSLTALEARLPIKMTPVPGKVQINQVPPGGNGMLPHHVRVQPGVGVAPPPVKK